MASELTAAGILAHVLKSCGIRTGTTIDRKDLENMAASLDGQLSALISAAERAEVQDRIIAGDGADSDSAMACLMYSAMAGKDGWNSIAPQHVERMLARIEKFKKRADAAEKRVTRLKAAILAGHQFSEAPCPVCEYNGPGYFQPETHPCAAVWHAAVKGRNPGNTQTAERIARTALGKEPRPTIYNKIFCPKCEADMILSANNIWKCPNCEEPRP